MTGSGAATGASSSAPQSAEPGQRAGSAAAGRRLETVLRHSSDAVVLLDVEGRIEDWNAAAQEALGAPAGSSALSGRRLVDLLPDELRPEVSSAWHRLQDGHELITTDARVQGRRFRLHLGAVVHQERLDGAIALWRTAARHLVASSTPGTPHSMAEDLRRGIEQDELRLHYQPIVDLASARPVATEALVRWQHPHRGLIEPDQFIGFAERTGLVVELGDWVLREACRTAAAWSAEAPTPGGAMTVTVNLSARQLRDGHLVSSLRDALEKSGCPPGRLVLEVTETAVMADLAAAVSTLTALKDLGVGLAIDDFGTGYSSLLYLKHFPVDSIKIDRSFVAGLGRDADDTAIVAATVSLAHSVEVRCVAEGVETVEHLDLLRTMRCDFAQGFLFSRPLDLTDLTAWFAVHLPSGREPLDRSGPGPLPPAVTRLIGQGASLHTIAAALNVEGSRTPRGTRWSARSVAHLIAGQQPDDGPRTS